LEFPSGLEGPRHEGDRVPAPLNIDAIFEDWPQPLALRVAGRVTTRNAAARALASPSAGLAPSGEAAGPPRVLQAIPATFEGATVDLLFLAPPAAAPCADPLEVAARLIGGIAHDLNNALMGVTTTTELLSQAIDAQHPARADVAQVTAATRRAVEQVRLVSGFARRHPGPAVSVDLTTTLRRLGRLLGRILDREVAVEPDAEVAAAHVMIDPGSLERIVARLALTWAAGVLPGTRLGLHARAGRARDGMPDGVEVVMRRLPSATGALTGAPLPTDGLDDLALPPEAVTLATEAGISLRAEVSPEGIAAVVIGLLRDRTRTTTLAAAVPTPAVPAVPPTQSGSGRSTILVVEDDATALGTVAMLLRREGYEVLTTTSPSSAMALFRARDARVDLLVTDVIMPTLDGDLLARQMLALSPNLPVLYMSGYPADILKGRLAATPGARFLPKPFTPTMLLAQVRRLLDDAAARR
jgi:two-component system cell cycle sensor histidine kinase/response regulator CckA